MDGQELYLKDGRSAGVFYCSKCRIVAREKEQADNCCVPRKCDTCGAEIGNSYCEPCADNREIEKEKARFEAAEKVTSWDGWVFSEGLGYQEGFASSIDDLLESVETPDEIPEYIWTCEPTQFVRVSLDDILQRIEEDENCVEDFDARDCDGLPELGAALDAFNEANKGKISYHPNYKRALLVDRQKFISEINKP